MSRFVPGVNDLQTWCYENNRLDLLDEWDYERNLPLAPSQISRGSSKRVWWICKTCGHNWLRSVGGRTNPNGSGCKICNPSTPPLKKVKYTSENFQKYVDKKGVNAEVISPYVDWDTNVTCRCKTCGHVWESLPTNLLSGHGCKICGIEKTTSARRGSLEKVQDVIDTAGLKITVSGVYKNQGSSLTCFCEICNSQWEIQAKILLAKIRKGINPCTVCNRIEEQRQMGMAFLEKVKQINPDVIICVGLAGGRRSVTVETVAINLKEATIPDNEGNAPMDEPVLKDAKNAYFSTLPIRNIVKNIKDNGIDANLSFSAGAFVCNETLFLLLNKYENSNVKVGFIHLPFLPEQAKEGQPSMSLQDMIKALTIAIESL